MKFYTLLMLIDTVFAISCGWNVWNFTHAGALGVLSGTFVFIVLFRLEEIREKVRQ